MRHAFFPIAKWQDNGAVFDKLSGAADEMPFVVKWYMSLHDFGDALMNDCAGKVGGVVLDGAAGQIVAVKPCDRLAHIFIFIMDSLPRFHADLETKRPDVLDRGAIQLVYIRKIGILADQFPVPK